MPAQDQTAASTSAAFLGKQEQNSAALQGKWMDYVMLLSDRATSNKSQERLRRPQTGNCVPINDSDQSAPRKWPIAVNIATKTPDSSGSTARTQLRI